MPPARKPIVPAKNVGTSSKRRVSHDSIGKVKDSSNKVAEDTSEAETNADFARIQNLALGIMGLDILSEIMTND